MDELERDYSSVLLADHNPPCLSLYQPTHRRHPENQQDPIRFRNLVKGLEASLQQKYTARDTRPLLAPFQALADDRDFWNHALDGLGVLATPELFKVYRVQRPLPELAVVADSFHTKPLLRILQSADHYQVLGLNRREMRLFEGTRDALDEIEPAPEVPRTVADVVGEAGDPERKDRVYGGTAPEGTTSHGTDVKEDALANDTARFFRAVDQAVWEHHSRPSGMPLLLAALPEHHHLFRTVSRNPFLAEVAIDVFPGVLTPDALRDRAWQLIQPYYLRRLSGLIDRFHAARAAGLGGGDLAEVAKAAWAGRIAMLLIEAERHISGAFDPVTGAIRFQDLDHPEIDDLIDDIGERALKSGSDVVVVPAERMPTDTGVAAVYRY